MTIGNLPPSIGGNLLHAHSTAHVTRYIHYVQGEGGTFSASPTAGYEGDIVTLTNTPSAHYTFSGYDITGATLTGNKFEIGDTDVSVEAKFYPTVYTVTTQTDGHGKISASTTGGTYGTNVTLYNTAYDGYRLGSYSITGSTLTGNTFTIDGNTTARANFAGSTASGVIYSGNISNTTWKGGQPYVPLTNRYFNLNTPTTGYNYIVAWWEVTDYSSNVYTWTSKFNFSVTFKGDNNNSLVFMRGASGNGPIFPTSTHYGSVPIFTGDFNPSRTVNANTGTGIGAYKHGTCWYWRGSKAGRKIIYDTQNKRCSAYGCGGVYHGDGNTAKLYYYGWKNIDFGNKITSAIAHADSGEAWTSYIYIGSPFFVAGFNRFSDARKFRDPRNTPAAVHEFTQFYYE